MYKALMRPIVSYGTEDWAMAPEEMNVLRVFERKTVRKFTTL
jgi:hypothetical protein